MGNNIVPALLKNNFATKRKSSVLDSDSETNEEVLDKYEFDSEKCTQRKKVAKTSKYIYTTLFEEQQGSDITINALNRSWNLHKLYLSQSPYFNSMFSGDWLETQKKEINIQIDDKNVTPEALHKVFSSFYRDEIKIKPDEAVSVLGAVTLLQMDELAMQCIQVMKHNVNIDTVFMYYECADFYSLEELKNIAFNWLLKNLLYKLLRKYEILQQMSCDLMAELVENPNLIVIQTEFSVYQLLKKWVFLRESKITITEELRRTNKVDQLVNDYFRDICPSPYLLSSSGLKYQRAFLALRKSNLISHMLDSRVINEDNIMPAEWFFPTFKLQWYQMLQIHEDTDSGPSEVSEEDFNKYATRCGRIIKYNKETNWRWTGYNYGIDIIVNYNKGSVSISKGQDPCAGISHNTDYSPSLKHKKRKIMYRIGIYSLDKKGRVIKKQETGVENLILSFYEKKTVMNFDTEMQFPVIFSANFLVTTPLRQNETFVQSVGPTVCL